MISRGFPERWRIGDGLDRLLEDGSDEKPGLCRAKLRSFRRLILLYGALRSWFWVASGAGELMPGLGMLAAGLSLCFGLSLHPRTEWAATRMALPILLIQLVQTFPLTHNHFFLEMFSILILSLIGRGGRRDEELALRGLQLLFAIVLFQTGLQKIFYGLYFQGEFLAFMVGETGRFASLFTPLLDTAEIETLQAYDAMVTGAGPYRVSSILFRTASNLVWLAEVTLAPLLLFRKTRSQAALAAIALVFAIQLGARELGFAIVFIGGLLLFLEVDRNSRLLPVLFLGGMLGLASAIGWLPGQSFMETISP